MHKYFLQINTHALHLQNIAYKYCKIFFCLSWQLRGSWEKLCAYNIKFLSWKNNLCAYILFVHKQINIIQVQQGALNLYTPTFIENYPPLFSYLLRRISYLPRTFKFLLKKVPSLYWHIMSAIAMHPPFNNVCLTHH